jgi:hypothetical protein
MPSVAATGMSTKTPLERLMKILLKLIYLCRWTCPPSEFLVLHFILIGSF